MAWGRGAEMDRLTERTTTGAVPAKARLVFDLPSKDFEVVREIFIRLAAYEDLELTPDEIEAQLAASQRRERAAVEDMEWLAGTTVDSLRCNICKYNPNDMGCELDGSQFDDDGECHFTWQGPDEKGL